MSERDFHGDDLPSPQELIDLVKRNKRYIFIGLGLVAAIVLVFSSYFQVEPEERAVVLRFGKPLEEAFGPGLHFKIPFVDDVHTVATERQHRIEFGFRSQPGEHTKLTERARQDESLMLTSDLQLVLVEWSLIYKVGNAYDDVATWLFEVRDREATISDISKSVMRQLVGDYSLHEVLTVKVRELQELARKETQHALSVRVPTGVIVTELSIRNTDVPVGAREAFARFNRTEPEIRKILSEADAQLRTVTGNAELEKKRAIGEAERQYAKTVNNAEGEAEAFLEQLREYRLAKGITRQWIYLQRMTDVLASTDRKILLDDDDGAGALKLLPLTDLLGKGATTRTAPKETP